MAANMDSESALIVPVPNADPTVGPWRGRLDPSAASGVPAHITVFYPFLLPASIAGSARERLRTVVKTMSAFDFMLTSIDRFDARVLWLRPEPGEPFRSLTVAIARLWPWLEPYDGAHDDIVPHLTIGISETGAGFDEAAREIGAELPIRCRAEEVHLIARAKTGSWHTEERFLFSDGV
jgi:hypothetical protein